MEPLKPRDKVTQHMTRDGLTLDNQTTGESVNVSSRETEQEYTAQPEGAAEKILERADELHDRHKAKKAAKDAGKTVAQATGPVSRLQFTAEERASPELAPYIKKAEKRADKLEAAKEALPKKRVVTKETVYDEAKGKAKSRLAAVLCLTAFSTTAFAGGTDPNPEPLPETTEAPQEEEPTTGGMEPEGVPVTPEGNATLVDDFYGDKQLITVTTKAGNYFYILIDRANEDKETAVHFLNQVDDADLQALLEDGKAAPETCTCTTKCAAGAVNTNCPVCKTNMTECTGPEPEPQEPEETEQPQEGEAKGSGMGGLVVFLVVALIGGGAALYFFKFKKPKADTKGGDELDEYDFGEDEDDEDEPTPEDEEPAQDKEE